ncbi:MAG: hypothetical protein HYW50_05395 [Candidatus Diapherotrites archaeon]|nr:hypothetical protein [Candidatus Diapherotrites archaeon]
MDKVSAAGFIVLVLGAGISLNQAVFGITLLILGLLMMFFSTLVETAKKIKHI